MKQKVDQSGKPKTTTEAYSVARTKSPELELSSEERAFLLAAAKEHSKPEWHKTSFWIAVIGSLVALLGLVISFAQAMSQNVQNAPMLTLESALTFKGDAKGDGSVSPLQTTIRIQNTGGTQAQKLSFTSIGWYHDTVSGPRYPGTTAELKQDRDNLQQTSPWQKTLASDYLDRGQDTTQNFPNFPASDEPAAATNYIYIEGSYFDSSIWPFTRHYTTAFCLTSVAPHPEEGNAIMRWERLAVGNCSRMRELEKIHPDGPTPDNE